MTAFWEASDTEAGPTFMGGEIRDCASSHSLQRARDCPPASSWQVIGIAVQGSDLGEGKKQAPILSSLQLLKHFLSLYSTGSQSKHVKVSRQRIFLLYLCGTLSTMGSREEVPPQDMSQDPAEPVGLWEARTGMEAPSRVGDDPLAQSTLQHPSYHLAYRLM